MTVPPPAAPKIYHIVHVDRLASIASDGFLWSDAELQQRARPGTVIGMSTIKQRRLTNPVNCRPELTVGDCVPFYFCPRSVMLYVISMANHPELSYRGGQGPIVHLEADLHETVAGPNRTTADGPLPCPMRARATSRTGATLRNSTKSIGAQSKRGNGGSVERKSRRNSLSSALSRGH